MQCALPSCSEAAKQKCAACGSLGYCSREHQRSDWKAHKVECQRIVKAGRRRRGKAAQRGAGQQTAAPEGKDAGGGDGGEVVGAADAVARHDHAPGHDGGGRLRHQHDALRTARVWALWFALGAEDEPIDEDAVKLVLDAPGLNIHVTSPKGRTVLWDQCSLGRSRNVELLLADGRIDPNQRSTDDGKTRHCTSPRTRGGTSASSFFSRTPGSTRTLPDLEGYTPLNTAANTGRDGCVELLLADGRVDVNRAHADGQTPLISACMQLVQAIDQIGAPELPTRCLVLLLKSRRISDYYMKESIAFLRQRCMPTRARSPPPRPAASP